ncbi:MAG: aldo/keto reductase [Nitrospinota bacterium]|nr:aldo/keto reductase [Nitrospinota bacterium]MDH5757927.1 aldo/keto reductase [Nitrospinota bacterium]
MADKFQNRTLGRVGFDVHPLGVGASYGVGAQGIEEAFDRGVNYFYWAWSRRGGMAEGIRRISKKGREKIFIVITSLAPSEFMIRRSVEGALRALGTDYVDGLQFYVRKDRPLSPGWQLDAALKLREEGKIRHICATGHHRPNFAAFHKEKFMDVFHVRYNAVHRGAETEVFPHLPPKGDPARPGVVAFTVTCWRKLINASPSRIGGLAVPTAGDCYRFSMSNNNIDVTLCGAANEEQMRHALDAVDKGPMTEDEMEWMRQVGAALYK